MIHSQISARTEAARNSHMFAALHGYSYDDEDRIGGDDELPDYEQSQREATQAQRIQASQRAKELERRWRERERQRR